MARILLLTLCFASFSLSTYAQLYGRYYNCYELQKRSVKLSFMTLKGGKHADSSDVVPLDQVVNEKQKMKVYLFIHFYGIEYLNLPENPAKPIYANLLGKQLPNDIIDSISLEIYHNGEDAAYTMKSDPLEFNYPSLTDFKKSHDSLFRDGVNGHDSPVIDIYNPLVFPYHSLTEFKDGYNRRDSLFTDGWIIHYNLVFEVNDPVLPDYKDLGAKFTIWFKDGKVIRKKL